MSQVELTNLDNEFVAFSTITEVDDDATYYIQNRGPDVLVALESSSTPDENAKDGIFVPAYNVLKYKKGEQDLYVKARETYCAINISKEA